MTETRGGGDEPPVAERLRAQLADLTPSDRKVARVLLAEYPLAGLDSAARLAARAGVSAPTVVRLATKLGFAGYPELQQALKEELGGRLASPLTMYADPNRQDGTAALQRSERVLCEGIRTSLRGLPPSELDAAVALLTDPRRRVTTIGGRFSSVLARYLAAHLHILRPGVAEAPASAADRRASLLDVDRRHVLVAFDYRRYQHDTVRYGRAAAQQGAAVVLFTDPWLSPLATDADVVLTASVDAPSPFDTLTPAMAVVDAVVAALVDALGEDPKPRLTRYDALNADTTFDGDGRADGQEGTGDGT